MATVTPLIPPEEALNAENAVLGSLLIDGDIARQLFSVLTPEDFLHEQNRSIFTAARNLFRAGEPVDAVTIRGKMGGASGDALSGYLAQLMEITPTSANWREYADLTRTQATLYRVRTLAAQISASPTLDECRPLCASLSDLLGAGRGVEAWTMPQLFESFCAYQDPDAAPVEYLRYGLPELDAGMYTEPGDVVVLGGYPSDGKTALALSLAWRMAETRKVGFFSLETDLRKIRDRLMAAVAQIDFGKIKRRTLSEQDWDCIAGHGREFSRRSLTVIQAAGKTATEIQSISRAHGFQVVFIDYVQLVRPETDRRATRAEQLASVSIALHTFAQSTATTVFELAQLVRPERGALREPDMHDLKETGQFEQDADAVLLLFRPGSKSNLDPNKHRILKVAKNKEGVMGKWPLTFDGAKQSFTVLHDDRAVMREMSDAGRAARQQNRMDTRQVCFNELPNEDDMPF